MYLFFEVLALLFGFGIGIFLVVLAFRTVTERVRMASWPRVEGVVRDARIHSRRRHHRPLFVVEYTIHGTAHTTECDSPTRSGYTKSNGAKSHLSRYPVDSRVTLFVDPHDPTRAFLWLPELHMLGFFLGGAAVIFLVTLSGLFSLFEIDFFEWLARF